MVTAYFETKVMNMEYGYEEFGWTWEISSHFIDSFRLTDVRQRIQISRGVRKSRQLLELHQESAVRNICSLAYMCGIVWKG